MQGLEICSCVDLSVHVLLGHRCSNLKSHVAYRKGYELRNSLLLSHNRLSFTSPEGMNDLIKWQ